MALENSGRVVRAVIAGRGAALRELTVDGVDLTPVHGKDGRPPFYSGTVLVPWPNRVRDGRWTHGGRGEQLVITEPEYGNALHGLLCDTTYAPYEYGASEVTLAAPVRPQPGYPFELDTLVRYRLVGTGLAVTHTVANVGPEPAPVAFGSHPFLTIGDVPADRLLLTVAADRHIEVDERLNPVGVQAVHGTRWDLRSGRTVAELDLDDCWTGVHVVDGGSTHTLRAPDGRSVSLWAATDFGYIHVFITRRFPLGSGYTTAIAVEPMTAAADAFNSGAGLRWLVPGEMWSTSWAIRYDDGRR